MAGAILMAVAYIAIICVFVFGMSTNVSLSQTILFAAINAVIGFIIMQFLKIQGISFAKTLEKNQDTLDRYNKTKTKDKKFKSISHYWFSSICKDILIRGLTIMITTSCVVYIVIQGTYDYAYFLLALVNLLMFACFGLIALVNAYDFFNDKHIPYLEDQLNEREKRLAKKVEEEAREKENIIEREVQRRVDLAKKELDKQRNDMVHIDRGSDILDTSVGLRAFGDYSKPMVLDSSDLSNNVLGGPVHASGSTTDSANFCAQETSRENKKSEEINVNN